MANVTVRMPDELKEQAAKVFESMGLDTSTAVKMFFTQVVQRQEIPFPIRNDPFWSANNQKYLRRSIREYEEGQKMIPLELSQEDSE